MITKVFDLNTTHLIDIILDVNVISGSFHESNTKFRERESKWTIELKTGIAVEQNRTIVRPESKDLLQFHKNLHN